MSQARFRNYQPLADYAKLKEGVMIKCKDSHNMVYPCTVIKKEDPYWEVMRNGKTFLVETSEITEILEEVAVAPRKKKEPEAPKEEPKKTAGITPEVVIQAYIKTREEIAAKKKEFEASVASLKELQEKRESYLASQLEKLGGESLKTGEGTCFFKTTSSATVADGQMFIDWILEDWENKNHLLERRVSKTAVDALIDDKHPVPPGINYTTMRVVQVRKA